MTPDAEILRALRTADSPLPIPELASRSQLSPTALETRIAELRAAGYEIELQPHLGYRFVSAPDCLIADDLSALLSISGSVAQGGPVALAREIIVFSETSSTNDVVARMARAGAAEGLVVFAERQTAGRGRLGRRWDSVSHKGLWFSLLLRPAFAFVNWSRLTTWAAVAIARGLEEALPGCRAAIKWPNDVYVAGRKVVGILTESATDLNGCSGFAIVGIGVNVNQTRADFPEEFADKATSLRETISPDAPPLDRQAVAVALLRHLDSLYASLADDFQSIVAEAESRSLLLGKWIEMQGVHGTVRGQAEALEPDGALRVRCDDGQAITVSAGEVTISNWDR